MPEFATKSPTLVTELFGASVGFRFYRTLRRTCGALLCGTALLLLVRRLGGAFDRPPTFGTALTAVAAATLFTAAYRLLRRRETASPPWAGYDVALPVRLQHLLVLENGMLWYLPTAALLAIAGSLSLPDTGPAALAVVWLTVVGGEAAWFGSQFARGSVAEPQPATVAAPRINGVTPEAATDGVAPAAPYEPTREADDVGSDDAEHVSQSWSRFRDEEGRDVVEGFVRVRFGAGSRQAPIHLSFCPPFELTPTLEAEAVDEIELTLITTVALPYAARIDARLAEPADEEFQLKVAIRAVADSAPKFGSDDEPKEL